MAMENNAAADIWAEACQMIRMEISDMSYNTFIKGLHPILIVEEELVMEAAADYIQKFVLDRYQDMFAAIFSKVAQRNLGLRVLLPTEVQALLNTMPDSPEGTLPTMLNPKYTFDTFVVGSSNRFAHAASLAVAELPGNAYNPLFIYGGVGLGKTHLMHAIGHYILASNPELNVLYVSSETFTNELIGAIRSNTNEAFREKFRNVDVLMIDDIQFIGGKEQTQEEIFHTFNALHTADKQIIISSDKPPKEIASLEERIRTRFEWGLIADIQRPDLETRIAILRRKAESENYDVPEEINELIATKVESNIRELEGCLTRVCAYAALTGKPITPELAESTLHDMLPVRDPKRIPPERVLSVVCDHHSLSRSDLVGQKRNRDVVVPRQIAMYLLRTMIDMSLPSIGTLFGGRDHTTAIHAVNKITQDMETNRVLRDTVEDLKKRLMEE